MLKVEGPMPRLTGTVTMPGLGSGNVNDEPSSMQAERATRLSLVRQSIATLT